MVVIDTDRLRERIAPYPQLNHTHGLIMEIVQPYTEPTPTQPHGYAWFGANLKDWWEQWRITPRQFGKATLELENAGLLIKRQTKERRQVTIWLQLTGRDNVEQNIIPGENAIEFTM